MKLIEKVVIKKGCHSRGLGGPQGSGVFLIPSRCSDLLKKNTLCYNNPEAGVPRQKLSGMTVKEEALNKGSFRAPLRSGFTLLRHAELVSASSRSMKGFTLIELLVVVLIIGILAAIGLPQYQKAVTKSWLMEDLILVQAVAQAQETYYLEHGEYATDKSQLDIEVSDANLQKRDRRLFVYSDAGSDSEAISTAAIDNHPLVWIEYYFATKRTACLCDKGAEDCKFCVSLGATKGDCPGLREADGMECYYFN